MTSKIDYDAESRTKKRDSKASEYCTCRQGNYDFFVIIYFGQLLIVVLSGCNWLILETEMAS